MKPRHLVMIGVTLLGGCVSRPVTLPARHAVVDQVHSFAGKAYWRPEAGDISALESELSQLWVRPDKRLSAPPTRPLSDYVVRYYGVMESGRRIIVGKGQVVDKKADAFLGLPNDRGRVVVMESFGGGDLNFTVRYDFDAKRMLEMRFNAAL